MGLVSRVLILRSSPDIHTFRLSGIDDYDAPHLYYWILCAIDRNLRVIIIDADADLKTPIRLPFRLFTCQTLKSLHLSLRVADIPHALPDVMSLPCLKELHLAYVHFQDVVVASNLIESCPNLLNLKFSFCDFAGEGSVVIKAPKLKSLVIENDGVVGFQKWKIAVNAPNLEYFYCYDTVSREYSIMEEISKLGSAHIDLEIGGIISFVPLENLDVREDQKRDCVRHVTSLLEAFHSTEKLDLNAWTLLVCVFVVENMRGITTMIFFHDCQTYFLLNG